MRGTKSRSNLLFCSPGVKGGGDTVLLLMVKKIRIGDVTVGGNAMVVFAGPCVIEDEKTTLVTLETLLEVTERLSIPFVFKASYDKANRTSVDSYRGPGMEKGLGLLRRIREEYGVAVLTDVHCRHECGPVSEVVDCIQIPAFLSRQTDLLVEAGRTGLPVNIKKGQFMAPAAMKEAARKVLSTGNDRVILTERGTSFGYNNLVVDFRSIPLMRETGFPVVFDATHSVQLPSERGTSSGGDRRMVGYLARAAAAVGIDGIFMEVHPDPERALSDGPNSIALGDVEGLLGRLKEIDDLVRQTVSPLAG